MGKFDPTYEMLLLDIPVAYSIGDNYIYTIARSNSTASYAVPGTYKGVLSELNSILDSSDIPSTINNSLSSYDSIIPTSVSSYTSYSVSSIPQWYSNLISSIPKPVNTIPDYLSTIDTITNRAMSNISSVVPLVDGGVLSIQENVVSELNSLPSIINSLYSNILRVVDSNYSITPTPTINTTSVYLNARQLTLSVMRNISPSLDYTSFLYSVPNIAFSLSEAITNNIISNLEVAKRIYLSGYEKFAGKRIGLTNFIDIYTTRETLRSIKELKVNVYEKMLNAINEYFMRYYATELDLLKYFSDYVVTVDKIVQDYYTTIDKLNADLNVNMLKAKVSSLLEILKGRLEVPAMWTNILDNMARYVNNKYNLAIGFVTDVFRSATSFASDIFRSSTGVYADYAVKMAQLAHAVELSSVSTYNDAMAKRMNDRRIIGEMRLNYLQSFLSSKSYKYDRTLEFLAHATGVPNTVNRGLSQFEKSMLPVSVGANILATAGNMLLPFL